MDPYCHPDPTPRRRHIIQRKMICFRSNRSRVLHFIKFSNGHQFPTWPCKVLCNCVSVHLCGECFCMQAGCFSIVLLSPDRRLRFVSEFMLEKPDEIFYYAMFRSRTWLYVEDMRVCPYACIKCFFALVFVYMMKRLVECACLRCFCRPLQMVIHSTEPCEPSSLADSTGSSIALWLCCIWMGMGRWVAKYLASPS